MMLIFQIPLSIRLGAKTLENLILDRFPLYRCTLNQVVDVIVTQHCTALHISVMFQTGMISKTRTE